MLLKLDHEPGRLPLSRFVYKVLHDHVNNVVFMVKIAQCSHNFTRLVRLDHETGRLPLSWFPDIYLQKRVRATVLIFSCSTAIQVLQAGQAGPRARKLPRQMVSVQIPEHHMSDRRRLTLLTSRNSHNLSRLVRLDHDCGRLPFS